MRKRLCEFSAFLRQPPAGTPPEVLAALRLMAGDASEPLPPRLYFETVEQSPVAISITDPAKANILYANAAYEHLSGYLRDELLGKNQSILSSNATPGEHLPPALAHHPAQEDLDRHPGQPTQGRR